MRLSSTMLVVIAAILGIAACQRSQPDVTYASGPAVASAAPQSYAPLVARIAPAVVTVHSARRVRAPQQLHFENDPFFRWFFGNRAPQQNGGGGLGWESYFSQGAGYLRQSDFAA